jgi:hypothetical protein
MEANNFLLATSLPRAKGSFSLEELVWRPLSLFRGLPPEGKQIKSKLRPPKNHNLSTQHHRYGARQSQVPSPRKTEPRSTTKIGGKASRSFSATEAAKKA